MSGAHYMKVSPMFSVPYAMKWKILYSSFLRFVSIYTGRSSSKFGLVSAGFAFDTSTALVAELVDSDLRTVFPYFKSKNLLEISIQSKLSATVESYRSVDGSIQHETIPVVMET